jgi:hypothetical protein
MENKKAIFRGNKQKQVENEVERLETENWTLKQRLATLSASLSSSPAASASSSGSFATIGAGSPPTRAYSSTGIGPSTLNVSVSKVSRFWFQFALSGATTDALFCSVTLNSKMKKSNAWELNVLR